MSVLIREKDRKWLRQIHSRTTNPCGMYPGLHCKLVPFGPAERLMKLGLVSVYQPHNPIHDSRYTTTEAGAREATA